MEEIKFTEKQSVEVISHMLEQTKNRITKGSGNTFLLFGYASLVVSVLTFFLVRFSNSTMWNLLWFVMFLPYLYQKVRCSQNKPEVITYIDRAIDNTWLVVGTLFSLTVIAIAGIGCALGEMNFVLMLPLSLLYVGIGTSITGVILRMRLLIYSPLLAFFIAMYMLIVMVSGGFADNYWNLYFGASCAVMLIIPGHILNRKV